MIDYLCMVHYVYLCPGGYLFDHRCRVEVGRFFEKLNSELGQLIWGT